MVFVVVERSGQEGRPGAAGFTYADENGNVRVLVGNVELLTESTGAETRYPAAVVLYDAEHHVIWQALR